MKGGREQMEGKRKKRRTKMEKRENRDGERKINMRKEERREDKRNRRWRREREEGRKGKDIENGSVSVTTENVMI